MKATRTQIIALIVLIIIIIGVVVLVRKPAPIVVAPQQPQASTSTLPASQSTTVSYACNAGKMITAVYTQGASTPAASPDQPPTPGGIVALTLSDGRSMTLAQTLSADGTRYANADESFVFWSKGNGALVLENNQEKSYIGCILVVPPQVNQ